MNRAIWYELRVDDVERAKTFYGSLFGWTFELSDIPGDYWLIQTQGGGQGAAGALMQRTEPFDRGESTIVYIEVDDLDLIPAAVSAAGGSILQERTLIGPEDGSYVLIRDPEGNTVGAWSPQGARS